MKIEINGEPRRIYAFNSNGDAVPLNGNGHRVLGLNSPEKIAKDILYPSSIDSLQFYLRYVRAKGGDFEGRFNSSFYETFCDQFIDKKLEQISQQE